jgi:thiol-disulfide isomerase/thioredoxin
MLLTGPTPERLLRLAALYSDDLAAPLLARALAELPDDDPRANAALARIDGWLATQPGWQPDAATYVTAFRPHEEEPVAKPALDGRRFVDLTVQIDGEDVRLFDIEGPIVLDVWATWCGPCKQSLPHLDTLARRFDGEVTFVAVSVDAELATAERYLARRGDAAFTSAFLGADGMEKLGVTGIPALFVFDGDHRLVAQLSGFGPGSTALDEAVDEVLAGR